MMREDEFQLLSHHRAYLNQGALLFLVGEVVGLPEHLELQKAQIVELIADVLVRAVENLVVDQLFIEVVGQFAHKSLLDLGQIQGDVGHFFKIQLDSRKMLRVHSGALRFLDVLLELLHVIE